MIIIKFFDDKNMVSVRDLTQNEINEFTGFDICIFRTRTYVDSLVRASKTS